MLDVMTYRVPPQAMWYYLLLILVFSPLSIYSGANEDLIKAVEKGNVNMVKQALKRKANANTIVNRTGFDLSKCSAGPVLKCAAQKGKSDIVRLLLEHGADTNLRDSDNGSALLYACYNGNLEISRLLIEKGTDVNAAGGPQNDHPLKAAAQSQNAQLVKLLIDSGADLNAINVMGTTALMWANFDSLKLLIEAKADVNILNSNGQPVIAVYTSGSAWYYEPAVLVKVLDMLIKAGADVNFKSSEGVGLIQMIRKSDLQFIHPHSRPSESEIAEFNRVKAQAIELLRSAGATE
jgi:hypothetical protein